MFPGGPGRPPRLFVHASRRHAVSFALPDWFWNAAEIVIVYGWP
jgi:kynureninase